jgi:iron complex transport system ATP-binding protein
MVGLHIDRVFFSYLNGLVMNNIDLSVANGEAIGLLGPNGSGKTTLIRLASGILQPNSGQVNLNGTNLVHMSRRAVARTIAVVPQQYNISFAFSATEVVMLGRIPFMRAFAEERNLDRKLISDTLDLVGISGLGQRRFNELSGGERQKVILAMALVQQPKLLLLDEPTTHLDIAHQVEILELVRTLNKERGLTVIAAMHDLNLASLYFDRLVLLKEGKVCADGVPHQVLTKTKISEVFSAVVEIEPHPVTGSPHIVIMPQSNYLNQCKL